MARGPADGHVAMPPPRLRHVSGRATGRNGPPGRDRPAAPGQPREPALITPRDQNRPGAGQYAYDVGVAVRSPPRASPARLPGPQGRDGPCEGARGQSPDQWWTADR